MKRKKIWSTIEYIFIISNHFLIDESRKIQETFIASSLLEWKCGWANKYLYGLYGSPLLVVQTWQHDNCGPYCLAWPWKSYSNRWRPCIDPSENWVLEVRADKCLPPQDNTGTTTVNLDPYVVYFKSNVIPGSSSEHENWKKKKKKWNPRYS